MKPLPQFIIGFILLCIVIAMGIVGLYQPQNMDITLRIIQYTIAAIGGGLMGEAVSRNK